MTINTDNNGMAIVRASDRTTVGSRFNPSMLATARCAQSLSQTDLARKLGISQTLISKWEAGLSSPDNEQVQTLSQSLRVQPDLLFVDRPRRLASMSDFYHRALSTASRTDVKAIHARCSIIDIQVDRLLEIAELPEDRIPNIDMQSPPRRVEEVSLMARDAMRAPAGPIENLVRLIEDCGGLVIDRNLEIAEVDALCRWVPELPKLFYVNGSRTADRMRFSLAHELGHTIMHFGRDYDLKVAEDHANDFASAFLLPAKEFLRDIRGSVTLADLAALKRKWRVSMQAIARRAYTLGVINESRYRSICIQMSRNGWRKTEPVAIDGETPRHFARLLHAHLQAGLTKADLAKMLFVFPNELDEMLADCDAPKWEDQGVHLRLVG